MKYKLKKDLPFAKAGDEVVILSSYLTLPRHKRIQVSNNLQAPLCEVHEDCLSDWIEEIKPREWYEIDSIVASPKFDSEAEALRYIRKSELFSFKPIKVREVIE